MPAIGPNGKQFLDEALPGSEGGHLLAMGEIHYLTAHVDWMREHLAEFNGDHNVGAIGLEMFPFMNVFLWAYKDGKLPVAPGKEAEYMQSMFMAYALKPFKPAALAPASLSMEALNQGIEVFGYDGRYTLDQ